MKYTLDDSIIKGVTSRYPPLTMEEQVKLFETLPRDMAEQVLVLHSLGIAFHHARSRYIPHASADDVFQYAALSLVKSAKVFDPKQGMPFIAKAWKDVEHRLLHLWSCNSRLADTQMTLRTCSLSDVLPAERRGDDLSEDDILNHFIERGRDLVGLCKSHEVEDEYIDETIEKLLAEVVENADEVFCGYKKDLERNINWFRRVSKGENCIDIARQEGLCVSLVHFAVCSIRLAIVKLALQSVDKEKWGWLFDKSTTVSIAKHRPMPRAGRKAWSDILKEREQYEANLEQRKQERKKWVVSYCAATKRRYASLIGREGKDEAHITFEGNLNTIPREDKDECKANVEDGMSRTSFAPMHSPTMNYDKILTCVYQHRYKLRTKYRPERGGIYSAEGYRACQYIEQEQRNRAYTTTSRE